MKDVYPCSLSLRAVVVVLCVCCLSTVSCRREEPGPPLPRSLITSSLFDLFFISAQEGWAAGKQGKIVHTGDGGKQWESQRSNTDNALRGIYFLNDFTGWVVGDLGTLLHTENAGQLWDRQETGTEHHLRDVWFADADTGLIVGEQGTVLVTGSGGNDWKERADLRELFVVEESPFLASLFSICFVDPLTGWIAGDYGTILHTQDGGATWKKQESGSDSLLLNIHFADRFTGWAVGELGTILHTRDGGITWGAQESGTTYLINQIACSDPLHCRAITYGSVLQTVDGGARWEVLLGERKMWLYGIFSLGNDQLWVSGDYGEILYSSDTGRSWIVQLPWE